MISMAEVDQGFEAAALLSPHISQYNDSVQSLHRMLY